MKRFLTYLFALCLISTATYAAPSYNNGFTADFQASTGSIGVTTTSCSPCLVVVFTGWNVTSGSIPTFSSVSDTASLTWHHRLAVSGTVNGRSSAQDEEYAISSGNLTSDTITVHLSATINSGEISVITVSGFSTLQPFDTNVSLPVGGVLPFTTTSYTGAVDDTGDVWVGIGATEAAGQIINSNLNVFSLGNQQAGFNNINNTPYWRGFWSFGTGAIGAGGAISEACVNNSGGTLDMIGITDAIAGSVTPVNTGGGYINGFPN